MSIAIRSLLGAVERFEPTRRAGASRWYGLRLHRTDVATNGRTSEVIVVRDEATREMLSSAIEAATRSSR
ncbi:MAG: hypothetical protein SGJ11_06620 [Phycisphaerae bacterium]|nr:hypothetical protein [Phycisphaerae bacterium]